MARVTAAERSRASCTRTRCPSFCPGAAAISLANQPCAVRHRPDGIFVSFFVPPHGFFSLARIASPGQVCLGRLIQEITRRHMILAAVLQSRPGHEVTVGRTRNQRTNRGAFGRTNPTQAGFSSLWLWRAGSSAR
jgi:hypothetical protein